MLKICFLIVGIVFVVYILVGCSLTNAVEKRISDAILPSKYKKYADIHQDSISYEGNTMVKFKMMRGINNRIGGTKIGKYIKAPKAL